MPRRKPPFAQGFRKARAAEGLKYFYKIIYNHSTQISALIFIQIYSQIFNDGVNLIRPKYLILLRHMLIEFSKYCLN